MATKKADTFANVAAVYVLESAATTQTSKKFDFPFSIMDKMGLLITRIEYLFLSLSNLNSSGDTLEVALSVDSRITDFQDYTNPALVDSAYISRLDLGAAASGVLVVSPIIKDFSDLPGGGLLVAPNPLYGGVKSSGAAGLMGAWVRLFYTYMELAAEDYWQLVESRRVITS